MMARSSRRLLLAIVTLGVGVVIALLSTDRGLLLAQDVLGATHRVLAIGGAQLQVNPAWLLASSRERRGGPERLLGVFPSFRGDVGPEERYFSFVDTSSADRAKFAFAVLGPEKMDLVRRLASRSDALPDGPGMRCSLTSVAVAQVEGLECISRGSEVVLYVPALRFEVIVIEGAVIPSALVQPVK